MSDVYESIVAGLQEAIEDAKSKEKKLPRRVVTVVPVKEYNASDCLLYTSDAADEL